MSIDKILIAVNRLRDYDPDLTDIDNIYESVIGGVVFHLRDGRGFMYDLENDILTLFESLD